MAKKQRILARVEERLAGEPTRLCALRELVESVGTRNVGSRIEFGALDSSNLTGLVELTRWRRHWRRPLDDWRYPDSDARRAVFSSLANHLLAMYPVPAFMATAWWRRDDEGPAHRELFVHVARGKNPRTGRTPVPMTRRMAPHASPYFSLFLTSNYTEDPSIHPLFQEHLSERLHQRTNPVIGPIGKMVIQHQPLPKQRMRPPLHGVRLQPAVHSRCARPLHLAATASRSPMH